MDVIVVGGGAAGMMAAVTAAKRGLSVSLFEKNTRLGKKILITGKGRCNLTNMGDAEDYMQNICTNNSFMYSALYAFSPDDTLNFFGELGIPTVEERGNRAFPESMKSSDINDAFLKALNKYNVKINLGCVVKSIIASNEKVSGIITSNGEFFADSLIIATGGITYPVTGSNGDGHKFAKELNLSVSKLYPSLVPVRIKEDWGNELQGLSLKNVSVTVKNSNNKKIFSDFGEMMFTHMNTVTGPIVLTLSRFVTKALNDKSDTFKLFIDLKPALNSKELYLRITNDFEKYKNKNFKNSLDDLLPKKLIPVIVNLSGIDPEKKVNEITKKEKDALVNLMKNLELNLTGTMSNAYAVVTYGGVSVDEMNPSTMESKKIKGLYFAGEVLDIDCLTGGYNLQAAFSMGFLAGSNC